MVSQTRSQAVRQSLHLLISPPHPNSKVAVAPQTPDSAPLVVQSDNISPPPSPQQPDSVMFSVLCQYDFEAQESGMLSFRKGQILDVVKRDGTGWWAAMPKEGTVVGWIPQAFVRALSSDMADRLRNLGEEFRIPEFEAEELYNNTHTYESGAHVFDSDSDSPTSATYEDFFKSHSSSSIATSYNSKDTPNKVEGRTIPSTSQSSSSSSRRCQQLHPPPSPSSPMPIPPAGVSRSISLDKPTPLTPPPDTDSRARAGSLSNRHIRRRPVMVNDDPTLRQLSTLIETQDLKKIDEIASPDITGSFDAMFKSTRQDQLRRKPSQTIKQMTKKNYIPTISICKPRYFKPQYADQIDEDDKGHIRFASIPALIERLTLVTGSNDLTKQTEGNSFTNVFLTTFRTFMTADQLFELLIDRFNLRPPKSLIETEYEDWSTNLREPVRQRVLEVFELWLSKHRLLEEEPHIGRALGAFLSNLGGTHAEMAIKLAKEIAQSSSVLPSSSLRAVSPSKTKMAKAQRIDLLKLDPIRVAEQLTLWEYALYIKITPQQCLSYAKAKARTNPDPAFANLQEFCATHDKLNGWVKKTILISDSLPKRADTVEFWIKVAEKCRTLNNFSSMSAIIIALSSMDIKDLHLTWSHVHRKSQLDHLLRHNEPTGGFAGYRNLAQKAEGPCVPFIGMYLTDLVHANDQHKQADGRVCFFQKARWYEIITNMLKFQTRTYKLVTSESTTLFIEAQLRDVRDKDWFWKRSKELQRSEMAHADIRKGLEAAGF
ncbi:Cell division control protein 25 [Psilocybe cubensis]|uniref:Cell division control protein 25 n=2 Tax=Psilocybe cubensis TaxID=181762 RepID=A0ACB8HFC3_PSICU|nr:Cell division control protein 25 [Psilocybe cubensis]KAH9486367.1 Cell division control protein 25 [Psilocybe cubensis]